MFNKAQSIFKATQKLAWLPSYGAPLIAVVFMVCAFFLTSSTGFAADDVTKIAKRIVKSTNQLPWFISAIAYLTGLYFGALGVDKLRQHVENPGQTKLSSATSHFLGGGALLALPTIYSAMMMAFTGGTTSKFNYEAAFSPTNFMSSLMGGSFDLMPDFLKSFTMTADVNGVLITLIESVGGLTHLFSAMAYMMGLYMGYLAVLKLKDYIEDPERNPLKEVLARFFIGGAFFALPTIYTAMVTAIVGNQDGASIWDMITGFSDALDLMDSAYNPEVACSDEMVSGMLDGMTGGLAGGLAESYFDDGSSASIGSALCTIYRRTASLPSFLSGVASLLGFFFGFMALLKLRDHMADPRSTPISQAITRFIAGGCFFALQKMVNVVRNSITPDASEVDSWVSSPITGYAYEVPEDCATTGGWLDGLQETIGNAVSSAVDSLSGIGGLGDMVSCMVGLTDCGSSSGKAVGFGKTVYCAVTDILGPMHVLMNFFTMSAGIIFLMIGISRLLKSEQDGPRAPAGIGTIITFCTAGVLISFNGFVRLVTATLFDDGTTQTSVTMSYTAGMSAQEVAEFTATISAVVKFMILIGLISFVRGVFILRGVAEGNQQSSMMAGMTHIIGGVLAINIGPFLMLLQATLGVDSFGVTFS